LDNAFVFQVGHAIHQSAHLPGSQVDRQTFVLRVGIELFDVELGVEHEEMVTVTENEVISVI